MQLPSQRKKRPNYLLQLIFLVFRNQLREEQRASIYENHVPIKS